MTGQRPPPHLLEVPHVGRGVPGLPGRAQYAQGGEVAPLHPLVPQADEEADGGGGDPEGGDLVALDDLPQAVGLGPVRRPLVDEVGPPVALDPDELPGAHHPADVGEPEEEVALPEVHGVADLFSHGGEAARVGVDRALGLSRRARGVEDEGARLGGKALGLGLLRLPRGELPPGDVASRLHGNGQAGARADHHLFHRGPQREGLVHRFLDRGLLSPPESPVRSEEEARPGVGQALGHSLGAEAREDGDRRHPRLEAGEHGHHRLGNHGHVDPREIARLHPHGPHGARQAGDLGGERPVGEPAHLTAVPLPDEEGPLPPPGGEVPVEAVQGDVGFAPCEPLRPGKAPAQVQELVVWLVPVEVHVFEEGGPEPADVLDRPGEERPVVRDAVLPHEPGDVAVCQEIVIRPPDDLGGGHGMFLLVPSHRVGAEGSAKGAAPAPPLTPPL